MKANEPERRDPEEVADVARMEQQSSTPLGKTSEENEAGHLRRVAEELGGANSRPLAALKNQLNGNDASIKKEAAATLGALGDRNAIALLRRLLEGDKPGDWELAVHGLRHSRDRSGWLCLESVALDGLNTLSVADSNLEHAFRLLVMGRTKTMDRLFRAIDGHSRNIPVSAAINFSNIAVRSVPSEMSKVMSLRLGLSNAKTVNPLTPEQVSDEMGLLIEKVRELEAEAWETVQRPRLYREIRHNYEVNNGRLWSAD